MLVARYAQEIVAGETFTVRICDAPEVGYASTQIYIAGPIAASAAGTLENGSWLFSVDSTEWTAGNYQFESWGTFATGTKRVIARERFHVSASLSTSGDGADIRSQAQKNVDALEAYLAGVGNPDSDQSVSSYQINNRKLENYPLDDPEGRKGGGIIQLLAYWRHQVAAERRRARGLAGPGPNINTYV
jgi:hypothetical protein